MTKTRRTHYRQLAVFYAVLFATGTVTRPHSASGWIILAGLAFVLAPWLVLRQPDKADA